MTAHIIEIDQQTEATDTGYKAFCSCNWAADAWSHSDGQPSYEADEPSTWEAAEDEAYAEQAARGRRHLLDVIEQASIGASPELIGALVEVHTPDLDEDGDENAPAGHALGMTSLFGGHRLAPAELDHFADVLRVHASLAKLAGAK